MPIVKPIDQTTAMKYAELVGLIGGLSQQVDRLINENSSVQAKNTEIQKELSSQKTLITRLVSDIKNLETKVDNNKDESIPQGGVKKITLDVKKRDWNNGQIQQIVITKEQ